MRLDFATIWRRVQPFRLVLGVFSLIWSFSISASAQTVVTSTADTNTSGTLRFAINHANAIPGDDNITFNIAGAGPHTINLLSDLPIITDDGVSIDGTTQPGMSCGTTTNANGGISDRSLLIDINGASYGGSPSIDTFVVNAADVTVQGVAIAGANDVPVIVNGGDRFTLLCSHIGVDYTGLATRPNNDSAMRIVNADNVIIGDGTLAGLNVFGGGSLSGLEFDSSGPSNAPIIKRNFFGLGIDGITPVANTIDGLRLEATTNAVVGDALGGGNVMSGNGEDGIMVRLGASATILGNFVGTNGIGTTIVQNGDEGIAIETSGTSATIGNGSVAGRNIIGGNVDANIDVLVSSSAVIDNNLIGIGAGGQPMGGLDGIYMSAGASASIRNNIIANNSSDGIVILGNTFAAIYTNSIFNNDGQAIDLGNNGVSFNDGGDGDSGSNDLLNYPIINTFTADGSTAVTYDIDLDVPTNGNGYRIEFYRNTNLETYGEGEFYLGSVDVAGAGNFTGSFTSNEAVTPGDYISATTTRKTGTSSFDITSEFAETQTASSSESPLVVTSTADTDTLGTLRFAINHANANPGDDNITFNIAGAGPHTINLLSDLPDITDDGVNIDGSTQPGASCGQLVTGTPHNMLIEINGINADTDAFDIDADDVTLRGLSIYNFEGRAIIQSSTADSTVAECLYVSLRADGVTARNNATNFASNQTIRVDGSNFTLRNSTVTIANDARSDRAIQFQDAIGATLTGNLLGLAADGVTSYPTSERIIFVNGTSTGILIGGTTPEERNVIAGGEEDFIRIGGTVGTVSILGNYIGTDRTGLVDLANGEDGIYVSGGTVTIGGTSPGAGNVISGHFGNGIHLLGGVTNTVILGNLIGVGADGTTAIGNEIYGVRINSATGVQIGDGTSAGSNIIAHNGDDGVNVDFGEQAAIVANTIYSNAGIGIDLLSGNGVSANDSGDGDTGGNDRLNFPVINTFGTNSATEISYDFNLDVPANANGYRIDFFKNSVADGSGHGEGEVSLGAVDIAHAGGDLNFTGTFTGSVAVADGDIIAATTTRKTGPLTYDITSEFSQNMSATNTNSAALTVAKTVAPLTAGDYSLPGTDVIYTFSVTNEGGGAVDTDTILIIDFLPSELIFFNGDYDGPGPSNDVIGFSETATTLTFDPVTDAQYSNSVTKPANFAACNYSPMSGYDPNVNYICFNPKGAMQGGNPNPNFDIKFRARIK